jgi:23S rRNA (cytidine1920-2'-O)/16S rRNA (cytidine1409-2'-O)-methyltransferase
VALAIVVINMDKTGKFVSRAGQKLDFALQEFGIKVDGLVCADFGCSTGGFTDCLLQRGAAKVYAIDTGYGVLDWKLRNDPRVVVMERTNAMHVELPETMDLITIDVSWTRLNLVVPVAMKFLKPDASIVALLKPHYEAKDSERVKGKVKDEETLVLILARVRQQLVDWNLKIVSEAVSPIQGEKGGNTEYLLLLKVT